MTYRIRTASEMTGIPRNTLIAWERRYGFVRPARHGNSYRSYSEADIAKLVRVKNAIGSGLSVSEAIAMLDESGHITDDQDAQSEVSENRASPTTSHSERNTSSASASIRAAENATGLAGVDGVERVADPFHAIRARLYDALTHYRAAIAERLFTELLGVSGETRIHKVFFPILRRIGDEWQAGKVSIAQEHYAAASLREQMVTMFIAAGQRNGRGPHAACTSFPEDLHELAALAMAVRLSHTGFRVSYLGPNLPVAELGAFCHASHPNLVCVSAILKRAPAEILDYASSLRGAVPKNTRLVLGGSGIDLEPKPLADGVELLPNWDDLSIHL